MKKLVKLCLIWKPFETLYIGKSTGWIFLLKPGVYMYVRCQPVFSQPWFSTVGSLRWNYLSIHEDFSKLLLGMNPFLKKAEGRRLPASPPQYTADSSVL